MKFVYFVALFSCVTLCDSSYESTPWVDLIPATKISSDDFFPLLSAFNDSIRDAWLLFKSIFKPTYLLSAEHDARFEIFSNNFRRILLHNRDYKLGRVSYTMGINRFSDRTDEELQRMRCFSFPKSGIHPETVYVKNISTPPKTIDWREHHVVTNVKSQGDCGSCWAFSTTGAIEGQYARKTETLASFSEQQLVDCSSSYGNNGCQGGLMDNAFKYVMAAGGIVTEEQYPYVSGETHEPNPDCQFDELKAKAKVTGYKDVPQFDVDSLLHAVAFEGPISVAINAGLPTFSSYHAGVYSDKLCSGDLESLNHGVLLVGYGEENGLPYWIIKNSWGDSWGDHGYIKILRNEENMCGVASVASFPVVESSD